MSTPLTDGINALTTYANETTGASDTTLSDAVGTLIAGYGGDKPSFMNAFEYGSFTVPEGESEYILPLQGEYETYPRGIVIFSYAFDIRSDKVNKPMLGAFVSFFIDGTPRIPLSSHRNYILSYYAAFGDNWSSGTPGATPTWRNGPTGSRGIFFYDPFAKELHIRGFGTGEYDFKQGIEYHYLIWD